jgi:hypothetical protein
MPEWPYTIQVDYAALKPKRTQKQVYQDMQATVSKLSMQEGREVVPSSPSSLEEDEASLPSSSSKPPSEVGSD